MGGALIKGNEEGVSSPRKKELFGNSPQGKGCRDYLKAWKISPKPGQKPIQCYRCEGWGHGWQDCPTLENLNWRELVGAVCHPQLLEVLDPLLHEPKIKVNDLQNSETE